MDSPQKSEEPRRKSVSIADPGVSQIQTLNKLQAFYDGHGFDTEGPYADIFNVLLTTCRQLVSVNKEQAYELQRLRKEVQDCRDETGALSIVTAEQIKDDQDKTIRRASRRLSRRLSRKSTLGAGSSLQQPKEQEGKVPATPAAEEENQNTKTAEAETSFSTSSPPPQAPMKDAESTKKSTTAATSETEGGDRPFTGYPDPETVQALLDEEHSDDDYDSEIEERLRSLLEDEPNKYSLHQKIYNKFKAQIEALEKSHASLLSHVDWLTPKVADITKQQCQLLGELQKISRSSVEDSPTARRHTSTGPVSPGRTSSPQAQAAWAGRAASVPAIEIGQGRLKTMLPSPIHALHNRIAEVERRQNGHISDLQELLSVAQRAIHELKLRQLETEDEVRKCQLLLRRSSSTARAPSVEVERDSVGRGESTGSRNNAVMIAMFDALEKRLAEFTADIKWSLNDAVGELSEQVDEATPPPSKLAVDLSQKFQLLALSAPAAATAAEEEEEDERKPTWQAASDNDDQLREVIQNIDEAIKNIISRVEVLEVYAPHQHSIAARPPLLGLELEDVMQQPRKLGTAGQDGVRIRQVFPGYAGANAGLRAGDVIVAVQEEQILNRAQLFAALLELSREYRCRCQLLMEEAYLRETYDEQRVNDAATESYESGRKEEALELRRRYRDPARKEVPLRGYPAVAHTMYSTDADADLSDMKKSLQDRANRLKVVLPRFEISFIIWREGALHSVCVLVPSNLALSSAES